MEWLVNHRALVGGHWVGPELVHSESPSWTYKENHLHNNLPSPAPRPKWTKHFDSCNINSETASKQCLINYDCNIGMSENGYKPVKIE